MPQANHQTRRQSRSEALRACIPKSEDEWQRARRDRRFVTADDIVSWVSNIVMNRALPKDLQRFIDAATFYVESRKNEDEAHRKYEASAQTKCSVMTVRNYAYLVRSIIALMDQIYPKLRHRAFEAVLLHEYYRKEPEQFKSCFPSVKSLPEELASQALYIPFIVGYRLPGYKYNKICEALSTSVLKESEFLKFVSVLEDKKPIPHILPAPQQLQPPSTKGRHDPGHDNCDQIDCEPIQDDIDIIKYLDTEKMFAIPACVSDCKRFGLSEAIQQRSAIAAEEQYGCEPLNIPGVISFKFEWAICHDAICSLVLGSLPRYHAPEQDVSPP
ncbi:hypothetical protein HG530_014509 [Fusarium avenaceum]|nr:hypothetical protein HG530_014509 [Fusarium avenaceum]